MSSTNCLVSRVPITRSVTSNLEIGTLGRDRALGVAEADPYLLAASVPVRPRGPCVGQRGDQAESAPGYGPWPGDARHGWSGGVVCHLDDERSARLPRQHE